MVKDVPPPVESAEARKAVCDRLAKMLQDATLGGIWGKVVVEVQLEGGCVKLVHSTMHETIKANALTS